LVGLGTQVFFYRKPGRQPGQDYASNEHKEEQCQYEPYILKINKFGQFLLGKIQDHSQKYYSNKRGYQALQYPLP
jgi:hypothetical protein